MNEIIKRSAKKRTANVRMFNDLQFRVIELEKTVEFLKGEIKKLQPKKGTPKKASTKT